MVTEDIIDTEGIYTRGCTIPAGAFFLFLASNNNVLKLMENVFYLGEVMTNKTLVAYFTKGGASEEYAKVIAETLTANGLAVEIQNLAQDIPDVAAFDTVILGTGVRMFRIYRRWRKVLKQKALRDKRLFMFLSSGMAIEEPDKAVEKFLRPLVDKYSLKPESLVSFPGKIPEKWAKPDSEKVTMKPETAKAWAQKIASQIQDKHT
jgi:menaquinone-dependent protoporphyrinogen oxidase